MPQRHRDTEDFWRRDRVAAFCHEGTGPWFRKLIAGKRQSHHLRQNTSGTARAFTRRMEEQLDPVTSRIIGCAITLHRFLGPGLLESVYHTGLAIELARAEIPFETKRRIAITYHGVPLGEFEPDFIVQNEVVVEVKSASAHDRVFDAQVLTYLRLTGLRTGLLLNFGRPVLKDGIKRFRL